jgi:hypothetical protein
VINVLLEVIFPLQEPLREPLLILECIVAFLCLEWVFIFQLRVRRMKRRIRKLQEKAYIWLFLGFFIMDLLFIFGDFHAPTQEIRATLLNAGYFSQILGALIFIFLMEREQIVFFKKYLFTFIFLGILIIFIYFFFFARELTQIMAFPFWLVFISFFVLYMRHLSSKPLVKKEYKKLKLDSFKFFSGFLLMCLGFSFTIDFVLNNLGIWMRLIGDALQILGIIMISILFITIPSLAEYEWQDKIESVFIMERSGACLYNRFFGNNHNSMDEDLVSSAISSIKFMLQELTNKDGTSIIEKKGKIAIIHPGTYTMGIIFCKQKLDSLQILLRNFIEKIEVVYHNIFPTWTGDMSVFKYIKEIAYEIFT